MISFLKLCDLRLRLCRAGPRRISGGSRPVARLGKPPSHQSIIHAFWMAVSRAFRPRAAVPRRSNFYISHCKGRSDTSPGHKIGHLMSPRPRQVILAIAVSILVIAVLAVYSLWTSLMSTTTSTVKITGATHTVTTTVFGQVKVISATGSQAVLCTATRHFVGDIIWKPSQKQP